MPQCVPAPVSAAGCTSCRTRNGPILFEFWFSRFISVDSGTYSTAVFGTRGLYLFFCGAHSTNTIAPSAPSLKKVLVTFYHTLHVIIRARLAYSFLVLQGMISPASLSLGASHRT